MEKQYGISFISTAKTDRTILVTLGWLFFGKYPKDQKHNKTFILLLHDSMLDSEVISNLSLGQKTLLRKIIERFHRIFLLRQNMTVCLRPEGWIGEVFLECCVEVQKSLNPYPASLKPHGQTTAEEHGVLRTRAWRQLAWLERAEWTCRGWTQPPWSITPSRADESDTIWLRLLKANIRSYTSQQPARPADLLNKWCLDLRHFAK